MSIRADQIPANQQVPAGLWRDDRHRYFHGDKGPYPSVTSIIDVVDDGKSWGLTNWAKRETAASAIRNLPAIAQMIQDGGPDAAQAWLQKIPDYVRDNSADLGTRVHEMVAQDVRRIGITPQGVEVPYIRAWRRFRQSIGLSDDKVIMSEAMVINFTDGFGGTLDLGVLLDGEETLLDVKTGNRVYDSVGLQLAGYELGEFTGDPGSPDLKPLPSWKRRAVLHLQPDDWTLIPIDVTNETREGFLAALKIFRWVKDYEPWVKGRPIKESLT